MHRLFFVLGFEMMQMFVDLSFGQRTFSAGFKNFFSKKLIVALFTDFYKRA